MTIINLTGRGLRGESQADVLRRTGQYGVLPTDTDAEAMDKVNAQGVTALRSYQRVADITAREAIPSEDRINGLMVYVVSVGREYEWRTAGAPSGPKRDGAPMVSDGWVGMYTDTEMKNLGIDFVGQLQPENIAELEGRFTQSDTLAALRISALSASALSTDSAPLVDVAWSLKGAIPTAQSLDWSGWSIALDGDARGLSLPVDWSTSTSAMVIGDSMSDGTWPVGLASALGLTLHSPARYSSGARQVYRTGAVPLYLTLTGNALPAGGTSVAVTALNGAAPSADAAVNPASLLNTYPGDTGTGNRTITGTLAGRHVTLSIPTGGSTSYSVVADAGSTAVSVPAGSLFVPDFAAQLGRSELWIWMSQNYFYSGVHPSNINPQVYADIDAIVRRARGQRIMIFGLTADASWTPGTLAYDAVRAFNAGLLSRWPQYYVRDASGRDTLARLLASGDGSAGDNADIANGVVPRSLRLAGDTLHLNSAGNAIVQALASEYRALQALPPTITSATAFTLVASGQDGLGNASSDRMVASVSTNNLASIGDDVADLKAVGAAGGSPYYETRAAAVAALPVNAYFTSNETGPLNRYKRTATSPFYEDLGAAFSKDDVGLGLADNTADMDKPVSTAQLAAVNNAKLVTLPDDAGSIPRENNDQWRDQYVNVRMFGAVGDGIVDDTAAFLAARDTGKNLYVPAGNYSITEPILLMAGQAVTGYDCGNFTETLFAKVANMQPGGGCFWYGNDTSTGQKKAPQLRNMILQADYPVRFNNETTAVIGAASPVPHLMKPFVQNCDLRPRVAGTGIGLSWSKCFDGAVEDCEIQQFAINVLLNGCDLNRVSHNRIRAAYQYQILELSASTYGSENDIRHNDILNASSADAIFYKTTARHARFTNNYLEQSSGSIVGFIDASSVNAPSYAGNTSAARLTTIIENNRIDQHQRATGFVYRYQPAGQQYGSIVDVGHSGVNAIAPTLLISDGTGAQIDELPFCYNQSNPAQYRFFGAKFDVWDGYQTNTLQTNTWDGQNLLTFGQTAVFNNRLDNFLKAKGRRLVFKSGFVKTDMTPQDGILPLPSYVKLVPSHRYALRIKARCTAATETLLLGILINGAGVRDIRPVLGTEFQTYTLRFTAGASASDTHSIQLQHRTNAGADIEIAEIELVKVYDIEVPRTVADSMVFTVPATEGELTIRADGAGSSLPATRVYRFVYNELVEVGVKTTTPASIDFTVAQSGTSITITVTGSGTGKAIYVGYKGP